MHQFLRSPPDGDARPRRFDLATARLAVTRHAPDIAIWAKKRGYIGDGAEEYAINTLAEAIEYADGDPDRVVRALTLLHGWKDDFWLRGHVGMAIKHLDDCWRFRILVWVVRTGMRFPGEAGHLVIFWDGEYQRKGRVVRKLRDVAAALVETELGREATVLAEFVVANMTTGESAVPVHLRVISPPRLIPITNNEAEVQKPCDSSDD